MHGLEQVLTIPCPTWCATEHHTTEPHDSEPIAVPAGGRTSTLFVRLTQSGQDPPQVEVQDDGGTVALLSFAATGALVRALNSLAGR